MELRGDARIGLPCPGVCRAERVIGRHAGKSAQRAARPRAETDIESAGFGCHHLPGAPGAFATEDRATGACIGLVTVEPGSPRGGAEVSYTFLPEWWGRGLAREAVAVAVQWARELPGGNPVVAVTQSANTSSRRLLEAIGLSADYETVEYGEPQTVYVTEHHS